jgi:hypothetical protein
VLIVNVSAVDTAFDSVAVADDFPTGATISATPTEAGVVVALTVAECVEFDLALAGADVVCSVSGAAVAGGALGWEGSAVSPKVAGSLDFGWLSTLLVSSSDSVLVDFGAVDVSDSVVVCAPPLLLMVTLDATWEEEDVAPVVFVVPIAGAPLPVDVDPPLVGVEPAPVVALDEAKFPLVDVGADPADDSPVELVDDVPVVSAAAQP